MVPLSITITPADLSPYRFSAPRVIEGPPNPRVLFSWAVTNQGVGAAIGQWEDEIYLSSHAQLDSTAISLASSFESQTVPSGGSYARTQVARVPITQDGDYFFIFQTDGYNSLFETNTNNNTQVIPVTFHVDPPDLVPVSLTAPSVISGAPGSTFNISYAVTNQGTGPAMGDYSFGRWTDELYFSSHSFLDGSETILAAFSEPGPIGPGAIYWRTATITVPAGTGKYNLIFKANALGDIYESNLSNNIISVPLTLNLQLPDLAPLVLQAPTNLVGLPNPGVTLVWGITQPGPRRRDTPWLLARFSLLLEPARA
jgi:hypothetical protein